MTFRTTLIGFFWAILLLAPCHARADACGEEIARQERRLDEARAQGAGLPDMPESSFATMHRQPTPSSLARAREESEGKAASALALARKLHREGREGECLRTLKEIDAQ